MIEPNDIEYVESIITQRFPMRNCGPWNRIKKELKNIKEYSHDKQNMPCPICEYNICVCKDMGKP